MLQYPQSPEAVVSRREGAATMIFRSWLATGIKRACCQSDSELADMCMHLHPSSGIRVKRTPCRQQALPFSLQAARFAAKLFLSTASLCCSNCSLSFRRVCRTRIRNLARCSALALSLHCRLLITSMCRFNPSPVGVVKSCLAVAYSGHTQSTWNTSSKKTCLR